ncbi:MAG: metal ABC transporter permease [Spirochaetia bacterium]|jgi:zinc/manganese transport system permease protein
MMDLLRLPFILHALLAASFAAVVAAVSGYFLVARGLTFAGHALPNIGFAGAAGAVLLGIEPVFGLFAFTLGAGVVVGFVGKDIRARDVSIGVVMTFALGLGLLFLALYSGYAARVYGILFGNVLGISAEAVRVTGVASGLILAVIVFLYRPLLFSTYDPHAAEARGVPVRLLSVLFMAMIAVTVSLSIQVMGALLVFTLLVGPAATAVRLVKSPLAAILVSVGLGVGYVWLGIMLAAASGKLPVSFFIATLSFLVYLPVRLLSPMGREAA